jgi:serine-type D-Ala-D-Ala carboxypeptidase/endopeptidase (penicillin-binding protein 4)
MGKCFKLSGFKLLIINFSLLLITSCSVSKQIAKSAKADVLDAKALQTAHIGISIFDPAANKYLYNYQGDKYFVSASNTKLPTCYAAMKYLGDSLVGLRYWQLEDKSFVFQPTADPTFLHMDFKKQPVFNFLKQLNNQSIITLMAWREASLGSGWAWNDYNESYMAERSAFPIYGNTARFSYDTVKVNKQNIPYYTFKTVPSTFKSKIALSKDSSWIVYRGTWATPPLNFVELQRKIGSNEFLVYPSNNKFTDRSIPFVTDDKGILSDLLADTLKYKISITDNSYYYPSVRYQIHSQPTDSLLKPMMHRSDNFFAEQSLLMVSNERLGVMNDEKIIDTLLKTDFSDLPQRPRWVDGSGLSRYNLFTPQDFIAILNKMKNEFGMERLKVILPTGGEGTISSYYKTDSGYIYGKTGTLSGVVAFSGFLYTKKGKLLIFSTLVNNHQASATEVRRAVEKFLQGVRNKY